MTDHTLWGNLNHSKKQYETCSYYCNDKDKSRCNLIHEEKSCNSSGIMSLEFYENDLNDIVQHTKFDECWSVEAEVVNIADEIAQRHHDIEDGLEYNLILIDELVDEIKNSFKDCIIDEDKKRLEELKNKSKSIQLREYSAIIVNTLTSDVIRSSQERLESLKESLDIKTNENFYNNKIKIVNLSNKNCLNQLINFSPKVKREDKNFKKFLRDRVLNSFKAQRMDGVGNHIIKELFKAYIDNPQQLPDKTIISLYINLMSEGGLDEYKVNGKISVGKLRNKLQVDHNNRFRESNYINGLTRTICDYISGMTDRYAISEHRKLYNYK